MVAVWMANGAVIPVRASAFVSGFGGEQFALPEALDLLRAIRRSGETAVSLAREDPGTRLVEGLVSQNGLLFGQPTDVPRA